MLFEQIDKKDILREVKENLGKAKKEILTTMLLQEELGNPLPLSYFSLLKKKVGEGIFLRRLGFGTKEDYNKVSNKSLIYKKNYIFRFIGSELDYQRLIIIDRKKIFFGIDSLYFTSMHKPSIKVFIDYFFDYFKKGRM